ncbi:hypothetical protein Zmor_024669 [Zophobas morio]|uniref:Peptidase S1 domain-containing protein n=1 Tax=Zophobas morio TaxID=2755281 RepID=A0AA38I0X5_9CUCU|nr:hypothetical protein Zmor_024669 [Zophobas morio]
MTSVSCVIITTLVVISLANLLLLVHVIMHSMVKCEQTRTITKKIPKIQKRDNSAATTHNRNKYKFMAALVVLFGDDDFQFVCGVAIISKKWVLTAAHCVDPLLDEPHEKMKVVSCFEKMKYGLWYDVEEVVVHDGYKESPLANNLAVISVGRFFKEKEVGFVALPRRSYKYLANSSATALGWAGGELVAVDVKLMSYRVCRGAYFDQVSDATFCAEKKSCFFDHGGFLMQRDVLVGVVSFGVGCGVKPVVYSRVSGFEEWFRGRKVGLVFKD